MTALPDPTFPVVHGVECYEAWRNEQDCPHELTSVRQTIDNGLPPGATAVTWTNGWTECRAHIEHPSWGAISDNMNGIVRTGYIECDACAEAEREDV